MKFITDLNGLKLNNTIVMIGKFDGLHLGHQKLLNRAVELKKETGLDLVIFTFDIIPGSLVGGIPEKRIVTIDEMKKAPKDPEIDYIIVCPFTNAIKTLSPKEFTRNILSEMLGAKYVIAGTDFRFGINRSGDINTLKNLSYEYGFNAEIIEKLVFSGREISSSYIKETILEGDMLKAAEMLGRPFFIIGTVEEGRHVGKTMGFPTVNFTVPENKLMPPDGVYATRTIWNDKIFNSITNIGVRPTFDLQNRNYSETHILDFEENLYGQELRVDFYKFIRPVKKFSSVQELSEEIARNTVSVREFFNVMK